MAGRKTLRVELDELRKEVAELRDSRADIPSPDRKSPDRDSKATASKSSLTTGTNNPEEIAVAAGSGHDIRHMESAIKDLAEAGEMEIEKNPLLAVGLAFLLGLLVGRTTR